ncbi:Tubulin-tyrosine ligase family protein [Trichomonas vaginalis G3]|uniref:Tubulin-tyrosine ligase family protein n=1 Tax=Trichomonas vaginalis (strain ATCC PRA-98 / G3) TaxID=412133 RepID=A2DKV2_TRIV3|nr:tubulin--tyrosine ligase-like protein 12 family [Trichomonas vaginalis G3]EAY18905.1 Tubulin-tyrosine ligase family protein [Trichomonas vaginalis G3]KAI5531960.1 tubulin--tyrosine ligase-like protein 12 family [Trichomonas vaginalis G3]|eukprot:XP_001579891.1 Tubulin-tyrosine ligase family protein [Trichomonas vaginalis G3]
MTQTSPISFEEWVGLHQSIFNAHGFPIGKLGGQLYDFLLSYKEDNTKDFDIKNDGYPKLVYAPKGKRQSLTPESGLFVIEHVWSDDPSTFYDTYRKDEKLRNELAPFMVEKPKYKTNNVDDRLKFVEFNRLDLSNCEIKSLKDLNLDTKFPQLESIELNGIKTLELNDLISSLEKITTIKAINVLGTPIEDKEQEILAKFPQLEVINRKFTDNYTKWALMYITNARKAEDVATINIRNCQIQNFKGEEFKFFKNALRIDIRGNSADFSNLKDYIPSLLSIKHDENQKISGDFVFDNGKDKESGDEDLIIPDRIWDHMQCTGADWCLPSAKGLAINHKLECNFCAMPAGSPHLGKTFFVFWPIKQVSSGDEVTSNLFIYTPFIEESEIKAIPPPKPMKSFRSKFHSTVTSKRPIKACIEYKAFIENLHSDKFVVTDDPSEADLIWLTSRHERDFEKIYATKTLLNQIEGENCLTVKDLLYLTCREYMGDVPWLPETFVMSDANDIARFLKKHKELKEHSESCAFIVKAFNQTRAAQMLVTESASEILKHSSNQYRIAQRYIWNPLNIFGCKFDLRFIVLLKSIKPFELFCYKVFWPRLAPKKWSLDDLSDYERHFTVMNYKAPTKVTHKTWVDFVEQFAVENKDVKWDDVLQNIYKCMRDMFLCCCQKMVQSPYTKGMYGVDLMITKDYQPVILECNFQPDCKRACNLCPTFVDDVFEVLFTDQPVTNQNVAQIPLE